MSTMISTEDNYQSYPLIKQSKVRKLHTYTSSASSNSSGSSTNNSPHSSQQKIYFHHNGDTDEGYASFTTNNTTFGSHSSSILNKNESAYCMAGSERLLTMIPSSSSVSSRIPIGSDSERSEISDDDDDYEDLVNWSSLNHQVQTLVSRFDRWLDNPLPDRCVPVQKSYVEHAYPILQRRTSSIPLSINLSNEDLSQIPNQSNYVINFVQNTDIPILNPIIPSKTARPRVHFNLQPEQLQHCTTCSRLIQLTPSSINKQRSVTTCPYCEQIYCSQVCQTSDWPIHKRQCRLANSYSCCGHILRLMKSNDFLLKRLSTLASNGYLSSGRGATLLYFDDMKEADAYVQLNTIKNTRLVAVYWSLNDRKPNPAIENLRLTEYEHLKELCMKYNPSKEFVCHVTIRIEADKNTSSNAYVSRTLVYNLLEKVPESPLDSYSSSTYPTLYLTSLNYDDANHDHHHMRLVFFAKLQVELRARGIEIEQHYPELYNKLCDYISDDSTKETALTFTPICLFMRHRYSQKLFMCVITPESEPDRSWLLDRCFLENQLIIADH